MPRRTGNALLPGPGAGPLVSLTSRAPRGAQGNLRGKTREVYLGIRASMAAAFGDKYEVRGSLGDSGRQAVATPRRSGNAASHRRAALLPALRAAPAAASSLRRAVFQGASGLLPVARSSLVAAPPPPCRS